MLTLSHITHTYRRASRPALSDVTAELTPGVYGILGLSHLLAWTASAKNISASSTPGTRDDNRRGRALS